MRLRLTEPLVLVASMIAAPAMATSIASATSGPVGMWWTEDRTGVVQIAPCAEGLCGRIVGQTEPRDAKGHVTLDIHGQPHCGLVFLRGHPAGEHGRYEGMVTNPDDGSDWHCRFWLGEDGSLRLRGYVMIPALGETQVWPPFHGRVATDCTISATAG